jgi:hypothetical protein
MEILGLYLSAGDFISVLVLLFAVIGSYWRIVSKLNGLESRNEKADEAHVNLEKDVKVMKKDMEYRINHVENVLTKRLETGELRMTQQEINYGRLDERLISISSQLSQVLDMLKAGVK